MAIPSKKDRQIRNLQSSLMGVDLEQSIRDNLCAKCREQATKFSDDRSRREFAISGLCQQCQDAVFLEMENDWV